MAIAMPGLCWRFISAITMLSTVSALAEARQSWATHRSKATCFNPFIALPFYLTFANSFPAAVLEGEGIRCNFQITQGPLRLVAGKDYGVERSRLPNQAIASGNRFSDRQWTQDLSRCV
jgi:hypothetical protein